MLNTGLRFSLLLPAFAAVTAVSRAQTIDSLPEGTSAPILTLGGVTLLDLDQGLGTAPDPFVIDDARDGLLQYDVGTPAQNNVVSFGGFLPGGDNLYGRCKSFRMVFAQPVPAVYFTMWFSRAEAGNSVQFDLKSGGQVFSSGSVVIPPGTAPFLLRMNPTSFPMTFDEILVTGLGPHLGGAFHAVLDGFLLGAIVDFAPTCDGGYNQSHTPCPCGNDTTIFDSEGCAHSFGYGARLRLGGSPSISNDTLKLVCMQLPTNASALFFQGTTMQNNGAGTVFGDGLRCAGGTIRRLAVKTTTTGVASYPEPGDNPISIQGQVTPGAVRSYQVWFRNSAAFCAPLPFNLSNGFSFGWSP